MPKAEKRQTKKRETDEAHLERQRAGGNKLWGVYISEAEKYNQGLIDGWRSDMDGLLLFAGLFSGVVTTFIIDGYKTLNPDSGSQTVALLSQISQQLANLNNGTAVTDVLLPTAPFSPPISALVCNALWFTSLALSLSSALVATLVEQWAREYQHRTTMFSSPSIRSRVYMYLYHGLQRFNMHAIVGVPLLLLHASLVLFFAGLVAFLVPVNVIIMGITSVLLLLFVTVYGAFTLLPLFCFDSPFQTPLTQFLWSLNQSLGSMLKTYIRKARVRNRVSLTDKEALADSSDPGDTRPRNQSMADALKWTALHRPVETAVKTETRAVAWTMRSLSDDLEFGPFVEGLAEALWDFDRREPCGAYQAHFKILLQDSEVRLCQRLVDFMAGSNSYVLERKDRLRRQLSVLRAIWAICAFSLHTWSPLQSPIGEADVDNALLGSKFLDSPDVQSLVLDVSALIRLNMIESRSRDRASTQPRNSDVRAEERQQADMQRMYLEYLKALSQCAASFQRDVTNALFYRSQMRFTEEDNYETLHDALKQLIESALNKTADETTADNVVFATRLMISQFAQISDYPSWSLEGLGPFLVRHPSLAVSDPEFDSEHHYTRFLCDMLCDNLEFRFDPQESVDALQLIYRNLLESHEPPRDLDTHLRVLHTLRTKAADIHTHRLSAIFQCVVLKSCKDYVSESRDLSEWERLPSIFDDEGWFRAVLGLDKNEQAERASAQQIYDCARVGLWTTLFEQCAARSPDQTERDLDFETLKLIRHADNYQLSRELYALTCIFSVIPTELQRRFADAAAGFIRKYPRDCLADENVLDSVLALAVAEYGGWITDEDALRVLETAVSEVQTDDQQESHRDNAQRIRELMPFPENIFAAFFSLVSDGE
ncbi:unnamed protein product [Mycena citricolor]|uniref:DUF6535 domain-containing protein n=1 Tax=Mycena citricolor TaxID=2018698 RepID=A0AAD2K5C4_9AGAR|nr:unnamed protein product [Mycena citricolor]